MRDDFNKQIKEILAKRVGYRCSNPNCRQLTSGPQTDINKTVNIGVAAHITAASKHGPRYNNTLFSNQRSSIENGIWLCQKCAKLIDNDPIKYTVKLLNIWKKSAEESASYEIEGNINNQENTILLKFLKLFRNFEYNNFERNRKIILKLVKNTWIKNVLEKSLHDFTIIELNLKQCDNVIEHPWEMILQVSNKPNQILAAGTKIIKIFNNIGSLLILGEPGSGKTTLLLDFAREKIKHAVNDSLQPIPIIFNLSSWAEAKQPFEDWLIHELITKYYIPKKVASRWINNDDLLLLLDGLDEVNANYRKDCIQAINKFRNNHGITKLVICSRTKEYKELNIKLKLQGAVILQPLTAKQIDKYLSNFKNNFVALRSLFQENKVMYELAQIPLFLNIMMILYQNKNMHKLKKYTTFEEQRNKLFNLYIAKMYNRLGRTKQNIYNKKYIIKWLSWLAKKMLEHNQSIFLIERIQYTWLENKIYCQFYSIINNIIGGLISSLFALGLSFGLMGSWGCGWAVKFPIEAPAWLNADVGLLGGIIIAFICYLGVIIPALRRGELIEKKIIPIEILKWQQGVKRILLMILIYMGSFISIGLLISIKTGIILGLKIGFIIGTGLSFFGIIIGSITIGGIESAELKKRIKPNEGIWLSLKNAIILLLIFGLIIGSLFGISFGLWYGIKIGVITGFLYGMNYGGLSFFNHFLLRLLLWLNGNIPWEYIKFLNYASERLFLQKVSGGYIFMHRLLMEYFASLAL